MYLNDWIEINILYINIYKLLQKYKSQKVISYAPISNLCDRKQVNLGSHEGREMDMYGKSNISMDGNEQIGYPYCD